MSEDESEAGASARKRRSRRSRRSLRVPVDEVPRRSVNPSNPSQDAEARAASDEMEPEVAVYLESSEEAFEPEIEVASSSEPPSPSSERPTAKSPVPPSTLDSTLSSESVSISVSGETSLDSIDSDLGPASLGSQRLSGDLRDAPRPSPSGKADGEDELETQEIEPPPAKPRVDPPPAPRAEAIKAEPPKIEPPQPKAEAKIDAPKIDIPKSGEKLLKPDAATPKSGEKLLKPDAATPKSGEKLLKPDVVDPASGPTTGQLRKPVLPAAAPLPADLAPPKAKMGRHSAVRWEEDEELAARAAEEPGARASGAPASASQPPTAVVVRGTVRISDPPPPPRDDSALRRIEDEEDDDSREVTVETAVPQEEAERLRAAFAKATSIEDEPEVVISGETSIEPIEPGDEDWPYEPPARPAPIASPLPPAPPPAKPRSSAPSPSPIAAAPAPEAIATEPRIETEPVTVEAEREDEDDVEVEVSKSDYPPPDDVEIEIDEESRSASSEEGVEDLDFDEVEEDYPTVPEAKSLNRRPQSPPKAQAQPQPQVEAKEKSATQSDEDTVDLDELGGEERISDPGPAPEEAGPFKKESSGEHKKLPPAPPRASAPGAPPAAAASPSQPAAAKTSSRAERSRATSEDLATKETKGKRRGKPWFEDFFNDDYLRTVRPPRVEDVARECDFIEYVLSLEKGATILDVGCGLGLHAIELTARGYLVVGLDLSLPMLSRAADEAQDRGIRINFLHADMREIGFVGAFDAIVCWGTTFGYFDEEQNRGVIQRLYTALKPMGLLLLDVVNRDYVIKSQPNLVWFEGDGCVCMEETNFNYISSRLEVKRTVILDDGRQRESQYSIRLYALNEIGTVLHRKGFRVAEVTGRIATPGVFFGADSPRMIILAERRLERQGDDDEEG